MVTLDMVISKETGQLLLQYQFKYKLYQPKLCLPKLDQVTLKLLYNIFYNVLIEKEIFNKKFRHEI